MTKKLVFKLQVHDEKAKKKALKTVSGLLGIKSLAMDMNDKKLTLVGDVDPVEVVCKLKKNWHIELLTVGPAEEPDKKKEEEKKAEPEKEAEKKMTESEKIDELLKLYKSYYPYSTHYYPVYSVEENPNSCAIW